MKKIFRILLVLGLSMFIVACQGTTNNDKPKDEDDVYNVTVIIKATDSNYWQTVLLGAQAAADDSNGEIVVVTAGPPS